MQERVPRINIESDEEISRDFCYFLDDKETGDQHVIIYLCTAQSALVVCRCLPYYVHLNTFAMNNSKSKQGYFLTRHWQFFNARSTRRD